MGALSKLGLALRKQISRQDSLNSGGQDTFYSETHYKVKVDREKLDLILSSEN